ncbi:hypothetical protein [Nostoc sp. PCC 7107]|nr:hypothetical protein [Nostoc sp. PCC 7107]
MILLNKTDLATTEKIREVEGFIHDVRDGARIIHSKYGEVPLP